MIQSYALIVLFYALMKIERRYGYQSPRYFT
jgi:hypothetical protein